VEKRDSAYFGPPAFFENNMYYKWRSFKKRFTWGFMISATAMSQYFFIYNIVYPQLIGWPYFVGQVCYYSLMGGILFGGIEALTCK